MGQKVNPNGFRYGITKKHNTLWYADKKDFATNLLEDNKIYSFFNRYTREYLIGKVEIRRNQNQHLSVVVHSAKPGAILGQNGENINKIILNIQKLLKNKNLKINVEIINIKNPDLNAKIVAEQIAIKLENRAPFRIAQKFAIRNAMRNGAKGIKTQVSGRLNGVDMARTEGYSEGEMKLHTLRQDVDFAMATARTTYGAIGVKVWVSKGELLDGEKNVTTKKN